MSNMKRIIYVLISGLVLLGPVSCKKDDPAPAATLPTTPEALATEDTKSGGVYKGVIIGSSGIFKLTLQNGVKEFVITIDGVKKTLTTSDLGSWTSGQEISNATFSGDGWSVVVSIVADGSDGSMTFTVPGHPNISAQILKETSTALVKGYEGTFAGASSGTFNFLEYNNLVVGIAREASSSTVDYFYGQMSGTNVTLTFPNSSVSATGTISDTTCSGAWTNTDTNDTGTWTGKRTL